MEYVAEQVGPADQTARGVDDLEIEDAVVPLGFGHQREPGDLAAVAGHQGAEGELGARVGGAVRAGDGDAAAVFRGEQVLERAHEVGQPADVLLEFGIGVVDHLRVEAQTGNDQERVAVILLLVVQDRQTAHIHQLRAVRRGHGQRRIHIVHGDAHIAGEQIAGADRHDAQRVPGAGQRARHRAHRAVAAHGHHHVGAALQRLLRADASTLVQLSVDELHLMQVVRLAERLDVFAVLVGLRFGGVDDECVMHLVLAALHQGFGQFAPPAVLEHGQDGGDGQRDRRDDGDDDGGGEDWFRHGSHSSYRRDRGTGKSVFVNDTCTHGGRSGASVGLRH